MIECDQWLIDGKVLNCGWGCDLLAFFDVVKSCDSQMWLMQLQ